MKVNRLVDLQSSQLWKHFGKYFGPVDGALREQLSSLYAQATGKQPMVAEKYHFDRLSQLEEYAGMMTHLFGCNPEVVNEVSQELSVCMPEVHTGQRADIIFVYDAKPGTFGDEKIYNPDQLIQSIKGLSERYPDKTIGIVIGNTHPDVAKFVLHACPILVPIEGEFEQVLGTCVDADVVVSVDTGFLHLLNFYKKRAAQLQREDESQKEVNLPHVIGAFRLNAPFPLRRFMPTEVERVMVSERDAKDISPEETVETVSELIR